MLYLTCTIISSVDLAHYKVSRAQDWVSVDCGTRKYSWLSLRYFEQCRIISIFHGCMVWIEKSFTRVTDRHHEACRVMPNSDPE